MPAVDWSDPCARAEALRKAYFELISTGGVTLIKQKAGGGEEEARYGKTDREALRREMLTAEDECRASRGEPKAQRRFVIRGGSRRG